MTFLHNSTALAGASGNQGGYTIAKSLRFRSSASAYLSKTFTNAKADTSQQIKTYSAWVKRGSLGSQQTIISNYTDGNNFWQIYFDANNCLNAFSYQGGLLYAQLISTQVFRDPSAWYHIVIAADMTQATSSNRLKFYVNGSQVTSFSTATYPPQNSGGIGTFAPSSGTWTGQIGNISAYSYYLDGYLTELNVIDGQALTPFSFGETDLVTGVWKAKKYAGTYGTNGYYLPFSDVATTSGSNAGLGKDFSGNGNYWNTNNISVTAGYTYDSMVDVPTMSALGSNYCVLNPLNRAYSTYTLSDGNLNWTSGTVNMGAFGTIQLPTSGKYYWEVVMTASAGGNPNIGMGSGTIEIGSIGSGYRTNGVKEQYGALSGNGSFAYGSSWTTNDVIGIAYDADTSGGQVTFYKNNVSQGVAFTGLTANFPNGLFAGFQNNATGTTTFQTNFGQRPFSYTPPTGFVSLNTFNLPEPSIKQGNKHFDIALYNNATVVSGLGFAPDMVWHKSRSQAYQHYLYDKVRGVGAKGLNSSSTAAEGANDALGIVSFDPAGVTYSSDAGLSQTNAVGWFFKANGTGSSNTAGSITSTVSANPTAGFSVVTWTGNGSSGATVGHGLGVAPSMVIVKRRSAASNWSVSSRSISAGQILVLNSTAAVATDPGPFASTYPSSSVITLGSSTDTNASGGTFVAYAFSEVAGYSKFGSYVGNGSDDGQFINLGFKPKFWLIKNASSGYNWIMVDTTRNPVNITPQWNWLYPNLSAAEGQPTKYIDILSNGVKLRGSGADINENGSTHIYMAFAENPFKYSLAR